MSPKQPKTLNKLKPNHSVDSLYQKGSSNSLNLSTEKGPKKPHYNNSKKLLDFFHPKSQTEPLVKATESNHQTIPGQKNPENGVNDTKKISDFPDNVSKPESEPEPKTADKFEENTTHYSIPQPPRQFGTYTRKKHQRSRQQISYIHSSIEPTSPSKDLLSPKPAFSPSLSSSDTKNETFKHTKAVKPQQTVLNFGSTPTNITCEECGMSYCPINAEDSLFHTKFHARASMGRDWSSNWGTTVWSGDIFTPFEESDEDMSGTKRKRSLSNTQSLDVSPPQSRSSSFFQPKTDRGPIEYQNGLGTKDRIVKISVSSKAAEKKAVQELIDCMNTQLSAMPENPSWKLGPAGAGAVYVYVTGYDSSTLFGEWEKFKKKTLKKDVQNGTQLGSNDSRLSKKKEQYSQFRFASSKSQPVSSNISYKAVAVLIVERIKNAHHLNNSNGQILSVPKTVSLSLSSYPLSVPPVPAVMGVSRIFTTKNYRRLGFASRLLDTARLDFVYGYKVPKSMMAWSQPSQSGGMLALARCADAALESYEKQKKVIEDAVGAAERRLARAKQNAQEMEKGTLVAVNNGYSELVPSDDNRLILVYLASDASTQLPSEK